MNNINKIMFACMMMTVGALSAFGGSRNPYGADPDTYTPGPTSPTIYLNDPSDKNSYHIVNPLTINGVKVDTSAMYAKYYPWIQTITLKNHSDDSMQYKFTNATDKFDPKSDELLAILSWVDTSTAKAPVTNGKVSGTAYRVGTFHTLYGTLATNN